MRLYQPSRVRDLIRTHDFSIKKSLGQNFLIDGNTLERISSAAGIGPGDGVLEIGPGLGALTEELALKGARVLAVEKDRALEPILKEALGDLEGVEVIFEDILKLDIKKEVQSRFGDQAIKLVANLPYYITTPILDSVLKSGLVLDSIYVMVQKELADRIVASPGTKDYGSLTVYLQARGQVKTVARVPATCFMPQPRVDSAVVEIRVKKPPLGLDLDRLEKVVRAAFSKRRKTVLNALSSYGFAIEKEEVRQALEITGIDPRARAEQISVEEYMVLSQNFPAV